MLKILLLNPIVFGAGGLESLKYIPIFGFGISKYVPIFKTYIIILKYRITTAFTQTSYSLRLPLAGDAGRYV